MKLFVALVALPALLHPAAQAGSLIFVTTDVDSDVVSLLQRSNHGAAVVRRVASADAALHEAAAGDTVLFLADGYPHSQLAEPALATAADDREEFWRQAAAKGVKVFLEFPAELPPRNATPSPHPVIQLRSWQALRPSTGAQPAAYQGVLAPRLRTSRNCGRVGPRRDASARDLHAPCGAVDAAGELAGLCCSILSLGERFAQTGATLPARLVGGLRADEATPCPPRDRRQRHLQPGVPLRLAAPGFQDWPLLVWWLAAKR